VKKRLPYLIMFALGFALWRGGFGFLATERTLTWRLPVAYADVRRLELQVWKGDTLVQRLELSTPTGLTTEPQTKLPLTRGPHRALASAWLKDGDLPLSFQKAFDPGTEGVVVLEWQEAR
jgi:hypothetical protein